MQIQQAEYDVLKEGFKDPVLCRLRYMEQIGRMYNEINWGGLRINHMGEGDPVASILSKFTSMAEIEEEK